MRQEIKRVAAHRAVIVEPEMRRLKRGTGGLTMIDIHILRTAVEDDGEKLTLKEMRKRMPPCPICGKKAYLDHAIVDGFD